jgi:hypothetical protein
MNLNAETLHETFELTVERYDEIADEMIKLSLEDDLSPVMLIRAVFPKATTENERLCVVYLAGTVPMAVREDRKTKAIRVAMMLIEKP